MSIRQPRFVTATVAIFALIGGLLVTIQGCDLSNRNVSKDSYSSLYDSLAVEMHYLDSLADAQELLLMESRLRLLQDDEATWPNRMDAPEYAWVCFWMAYFNNRLGELPEAKRYIGLSMSRIDSLDMTPNNLVFITSILNNAAGVEAELGDFAYSTELLFRAMSYYKGDTLNAEFVDFYNNIGHNYNITGDYDLAKHYFEKHIALAKQLEDEEEFGIYHFNVGDMYHNMKRYVESIDQMNQAIHYFDKFGRSEDVLHANTMLASNYVALGRLAEAEARLEGNMEQAEQLRLWEVFVETAISLFDLHVARGDEPEAFAAVEQGLSRIRINNTARMQRKLYDRLIDYHDQKGDFRLALQYLSLQNALRDSLFDADKHGFMREMTVKYETDLKIDQIGRLELENNRARQANVMYLAGVALLVAIISLIAWLFRRISIQKRSLTKVNATKDKLFSIIAHDLRSPIIALQGMDALVSHHVKNGNREKLLQLGNKVGDTLNRINHLLDNLLNWAMTNSSRIAYTPVEHDLARLLDDVLAVHKPAAEARDIRIVSNVSSAPVWIDWNMTSAVLRNVISNAIKYTPRGSAVTIDGAYDTGYYVVHIRDEGTGIPQHVIDVLQRSEEALAPGGDKQSFGLGLRLATYFARKNAGRLIVRNGTEGAVAELYLPLVTST